MSFYFSPWCHDNHHHPSRVQLPLCSWCHSVPIWGCNQVSKLHFLPMGRLIWHTHAPTQLDRTGCVLLFSDAFDWWNQIKTIGGICRELILQNCGGVKISRSKWHWILCMTHVKQTTRGKWTCSSFPFSPLCFCLFTLARQLILHPQAKAVWMPPDTSSPPLQGEGWAWFAYYFSWDELLFGLAAVILKKTCILL